MKEILTVFRGFTGSGFLTILYLMTLLYLWTSEKNPAIRAILVYGASILQGLFFFPLFYYGYQILDQGTYYRILWILPMTITIGYASVKILGRYPVGSAPKPQTLLCHTNLPIGFNRRTLYQPQSGMVLRTINQDRV